MPSEEFIAFASSRMRDIQEPEADKPQGSSCFLKPPGIGGKKQEDKNPVVDRVFVLCCFCSCLE